MFAIGITEDLTAPTLTAEHHCNDHNGEEDIEGERDGKVWKRKVDRTFTEETGGGGRSLEAIKGCHSWERRPFS